MGKAELREGWLRLFAGARQLTLEKVGVNRWIVRRGADALYMGVIHYRSRLQKWEAQPHGSEHSSLWDTPDDALWKMIDWGEKNYPPVADNKKEG